LQQIEKIFPNMSDSNIDSIFYKALIIFSDENKNIAEINDINVSFYLKYSSIERIKWVYNIESFENFICHLVYELFVGRGVMFD